MPKYWCFVCQKQFQSSVSQVKACPVCKQEAFQQVTQSSNPQAFHAYQPVQPSSLPLNPQQPQSQQQQPQQAQQQNVQNPFNFLQPLIGLSNAALGNHSPFSPNFINTISMTMTNPQFQQQQPQSQFQQQQPQPQSQQQQSQQQQQQMPQFSDPNNFLQNILSNLPQIMNFSLHISQALFQNLVNSGQSFRPATPAQINALQNINNPHDCAICQGSGSGENTNNQGFKLKCGHQFHKECILPWFSRANTCPTCRDTL